MDERCYTIARARCAPEGQGLWNGTCWRDAATLEIDQFHPRSSTHHPRTRAKLLYDFDGFHVLFDVADRYVRAIRQGYQQPVSRDSCVECFVEPLPGRGYFNFEVNCGGALLVHHVIDAARPAVAEHVLPESLLRQVRIYHSLPAHIEPEITEPITWQVELSIPWSFFETELACPVPRGPGAVWRANLYKCADHTSHPHWASWSPIGPVLNFHAPSYFSSLVFGD